jgi:hypothetical protein
MAERKTGAGAKLSGVLEQSAPPSPPPEPEEPEQPAPADEPAEGEPAAPPRGRGAAPGKPRAAAARAARRIRGRTVYIPDDLFERVLVQAHRKDKTISEYVVAILDRQVPDHRVVRAESPEGS